MLKDFLRKLENFRDRAIAKIKEVYEDLTQRVKNAVPTPEEGSLQEILLRSVALALGIAFVYYSAQFMLASALLGAPALVLLAVGTLLYWKGVQMLKYAVCDSITITPSMEVV